MLLLPVMNLGFAWGEGAAPSITWPGYWGTKVGWTAGLAILIFSGASYAF